MSKPTDADYPAPYIHRRRVRWGDADPANIAYTVRFFDYAMEAIEGWFDDVLDSDWYIANTEHGMGSPFVHIEMDIRAPLRPREMVNVAVLVGDPGRSSIRFRVEARKDDDTLVFEGVFVCSVIKAGAMHAIEMPDHYRRRIDEYRRRCADAVKVEA